VLPPEAVSAVVKPAQMEGDEALAVRVGVGITVKVNVVVLVHPEALVPVSV
jgi:hypothetical protein